jgi:GlcNAc-P-P-Und epimerase
MSETKTAIIFGGTGFIGSAAAASWSKSGRFDQIILADIVEPKTQLAAGVEFLKLDVRSSVNFKALEKYKTELIVNLAAVHREPGHEAHEYYETNIKGAQNVCEFAEKIACNRILFTSSISVYGSSPNGSVETDPTVPNTAYGASKLIAEHIHRDWLAKAGERELSVFRPAVIYGPGDPGNILRMYKAVKKGIFFLPNGTDVRKSYGYVSELITAFEFVLDRRERLTTANFAQPGAGTLTELAAKFAAMTGRKPKAMRAPLWPLMQISRVVTFLSGGRSPIHPVRVAKLTRPTYVEPQKLMQLGFPFRMNLERAFADWRTQSPKDLE